MDEVSVFFRNDFPLEKLSRWGCELVSKGYVVPGFIPPDCGALHPAALWHMHDVERILPKLHIDLNSVSEIIKITSSQRFQIRDESSENAAKLMACCLFNGILIDPTVAFQEKAHWNGHDRAVEDLQKFRAADNTSPPSWIRLIKREKVNFKAKIISEGLEGDLSAPPKRWERNYLIALKIADLELQEGLSRINKIVELLRWLRTDLYFAGPAAIFGAMYLSPTAKKRGLMHKLRSPNRNDALQGVKNQVWDLTHLSEFGKAVREGGEAHRLFFATGDGKLGSLASLIALLPSADRFTEVLCQWWPESDAVAIGRVLSEMFEEAVSRERPPLDSKPPGWTSCEAEQLESKVLTWSPSQSKP